MVQIHIRSSRPGAKGKGNRSFICHFFVRIEAEQPICGFNVWRILLEVRCKAEHTKRRTGSIPVTRPKSKIRENIMTFAEAYNEMLKGKTVKRAGWEGYWYIHPQTSELVIHKADGEELANTSDDLKQTIENTLAEDWCVTDGVSLEEAIRCLTGIK